MALINVDFEPLAAGLSLKLSLNWDKSRGSLESPTYLNRIDAR